jgi:intracellular septation protein
MTDSLPKQTAKELGTGMRLLLDIGPLILFFIANYRFGIFTATAAFIVAILIAMMVSLALTRRVTALQLFSAVMVVVMGGLTLYFHNETFIKIKPTIYYGFVAMILGYGLLANKPILKSVLGSAYPGLDAAGWTKLTRNWALFFAFMAVVNEAVWRNTSTDFWIGFKMWGAIPATLLFALANVPMLMRHGLSNDEAASANEPGPVE